MASLFGGARAIVASNWASLAINALAVTIAIALGFPLAKVVHSIWAPSRPLQQIPPQAESAVSRTFSQVGLDYVILGDTRCEYCGEGVKLLDELGANYRVIYLDREPQSMALYEQLGAPGVPILISRKQFIVGFVKSSWLSLIHGPAVDLAH